MKAVLIHNTGTPDVMHVEEVPQRRLEEGEVLVKVRLVGINFLDVKQRKGEFPVPSFPHMLGIEGVGVVEESRSHNLEPGQRVGFITPHSAYAEKIVLNDSNVIKIPNDLEDETVAASLVQGLTAEYLVKDSYVLKKGDRCLIHAAAGGVGVFLTQMAKKCGAYVIGTVSNEEKAQLAKKCGADETILYTQKNFAEEVNRLTDHQGVHVVYDAVGKSTFYQNFDCMGVRGHLVSYGQASGPIDPLDLNRLRRKSLTVTCPSLFDYIASHESFQKLADQLFDSLSKDKIDVIIDQKFTLEEVVKAHSLLEGRKTKGKVLLAIE
ncbi:MAG: quinone oxidoreductase [Chlamydiales bacterium]